MEFISLEHAFKQDYIKSLPHLTWLDLTANEKLLIELVLSYRRSGLNFYMNHVDIADRLVLKDTKTKAKSVGNIIRQLQKKGYMTKVQTFNYNGKNGGSSVTLTVDETYLEQQLHAAFNPVSQVAENPPQAAPILELEPVETQLKTEVLSGSTDTENRPSNGKTYEQTAAEFKAELEAMEDEPRAIPNLPCFATIVDCDQFYDEVEDYGYKELETMEGFKLLLQGLMGFEDMYSKRGMLQSMIDNEQGWDLETMKEAFASVILR